MKNPPELIALLNAEADRISTAKIGDGLTIGGCAFTIAKRSGTSITLRRDLAAPDPDHGEPIFYQDPTGETIEIVLISWIDADGNDQRRWMDHGGRVVLLGRYPVLTDEP